MTLKGGRVSTVTQAITLVGPRAAGYARRDRVERPAVALAARLRAIRPELPFLYGMELLPPGTEDSRDWFRPVDVLNAMFARIGAEQTGTELAGTELAGSNPQASPAVTAARLATSLAYAVLGRPAIGLVLARRVGQIGSDSLLLRLDAGGHLEQAAVSDPTTSMLAHDPMSSHPDARVLPDEAALVGHLADQALATLQPLIEDLHRRTRFGVVPMWNLAADSALGPSTVVPLLAGFEQQSGRRIAAAVIDALVERGAPIRRRGTVEPVSTSRGEVLAPVRGSCCLHYREHPDTRQDLGRCSTAHRPTDETVCASCPLLSTARRADRFEATLPGTHQRSHCE